MTIDDELLIELFKPDANGKIGENALIVKIVGTTNFEYELEDDISGVFTNQEKGVLDIYIGFPDKKGGGINIELENDYAWDFGKSLRKLKKYSKSRGDVRIIIPKKFERFAPLYENEGFRVYLWSAKRKWECLKCGKITLDEGRYPKCKCGNKNRSDFELNGLSETEIEEFLVINQK